MPLMAHGVEGPWTIQLYADGFVILHNCEGKKRKKHLKNFAYNKPVWANTFETKFAKLLEQWKGQAHCIRCRAEIPSVLILAAKMRNIALINSLGSK